MKKIILILSLIAVNHMETKAQQETQSTTATYLTAIKFTSFPEQNTFSKNGYLSGKNDTDKDYNYYMQKSKRQRTVGWVTLGSGIVLSGIGLLIAGNSEPTTDIYGNLIDDDNSSIAAVLTIAGAASGIVSIPFMIMASSNRHKAKVILKAQKTGFGVPQNVDKNIMGVTMRLPIGR